MQSVINTPAPLKSLTIIWHEGTGEFDGRTFQTWGRAQFAFHRIFAQHMNSDSPAGTYSKVKVQIEWADGQTITDRIDVGTNKSDYFPQREKLGAYVQRYCRISGVSFEDTPSAAAQPAQQPKKSTKTGQKARICPKPTQTPAPAENSPKNSPKSAIIDALIQSALNATEQPQNPPKIAHELTFDELCARQINYPLN